MGDDVDRCRRVERDAGAFAELPDDLERAVEVRPGLGVDGESVGAGLGEGGEIGIGRRDHQMDVERLLRVRPDRFHDIGPDRDVGDEVAVHHVDMDPVGAGRVDGAHLLAKSGEVGGEDRGRDQDGAGHRFRA